MAKRPCLDCGALTIGSRCAKHQRTAERQRTSAKRQRRPHRYAEDKRRAAAVKEWRANFGDWCPGWERSPHPSSDLTADHLTPVAAGGPEGGPLGILCRSCNSRKQAQRPE